MEQKIFNILARMLNKRTNIDDATDQLLHLFSVRCCTVNYRQI